MQQMAGNMGLLNPFVLNQFSVPNGYGPYSQVENKKTNMNTDKHTTKQILATGTETQPSKSHKKNKGKKTQKQANK